MIFAEGSSALTRLSDCLKVNLEQCLALSQTIVDHHRAHAPLLEALKALAVRYEKGSISVSDVEREAADAHRLHGEIPLETGEAVIAAQARLHSFTLTTILTSCFCLESYINALAFHLFREKDFLGLLREGHDATADILMEAIDRMKTNVKWETLGKLQKGAAFDRSASPYQDLRILFNFRNDLVHDKVADYQSDRARKRYQSRLPDPVLGVLNLKHAIYGAETYWTMVEEVHRLTGYGRVEFHRHYNLSPWPDEDFRQELNDVAAEYKRLVPSA